MILVRSRGTTSQPGTTMPDCNPHTTATVERIELDVECLEKMNPALGADYFYKKKVESPEASAN
jgi:hypothetical protein